MKNSVARMINSQLEREKYDQTETDVEDREILFEEIDLLLRILDTVVWRKESVEASDGVVAMVQ